MGLIAGQKPAPKFSTGKGNEMTIARKITGIATAAAIAVTALVPMATAANADSWRDGRGGWRDGRGDRHYGYNDDRRYKKHHRNHGRRYVVRKRDNTGKYIAIGVGALVLGAILSDAARR